MDPKHPSIPGKLKGNFVKFYPEGQKYLKAFSKSTGKDGWKIEVEGDLSYLASKARYESSGIVVWDYGTRMGEVIATSYLKYISMMFDDGKPNKKEGILEQFLEVTPNRKFVLRYDDSRDEETRPHQQISFEGGNMVITFAPSQFGVNLDEDVLYCHLEDVETFYDPK